MEIKEKEIWKTIEDYPNYQISSLGRVKSLKFGKERILKQEKNKKGYYLVFLCEDGKRKGYSVHRLVATAFIPNPQNYPCVNHKNESKTDNRVNNLEWCTHQYNNNYGTHNERIANAHKGRKQSQEHIEKCTKAHQKPILQFNKQGTKIIGKWDSATQASRELKINQGHICNCCNGKRNFCGGFKWMYLQDYIDRMNKLYQMVLKKAS